MKSYLKFIANKKSPNERMEVSRKPGNVKFYKFNHINYILLFSAILLFLLNLSCSFLKNETNDNKSHNDRISWFPKIDIEKRNNKKEFYFIKGFEVFQQTTEYTAGPAALLNLASYYKIKGINPDKETELKIAKEVGTRFPETLKDGEKLGTKPDEMINWLNKNGFDAKVEYEEKNDGSALNKLRENIKNGIPTIVEWADLGGNWVVAVGYDTRGNDDPWDDVLILADAYDKYDDYKDGYSFVNANRFYWLWFDAFYFDKITWRTMITAIPIKK